MAFVLLGLICGVGDRHVVVVVGGRSLFTCGHAHGRHWVNEMTGSGSLVMAGEG